MNQTQRLALELAPETSPEADDAGMNYWRSLAELAHVPEVQQVLAESTADVDHPTWHGPDRRRFLSMLGASVALAGLSGCFYRPKEQILPYVNQPEGETPGNPQYFATAMPLAGYGTGLLVKSMTGRPVKVEGNPDHPTGRLPVNAPPDAHFGPTDVFAQASVLSLYDPDRSRAVVRGGAIRSWDAFLQEVRTRLQPNQSAEVDTNLRIGILTETVTSPSLAWQIDQVLNRFPRARWYVYEPAGQENCHAGLRQALGRDAAVKYDFTQCNVVLSLEADFLACGPGSVRYARDFTARRRASHSSQGAPNRLYVVESTPTVTGSTADHRWAIRSGQVLSFARAVAAEVGVRGLPSESSEAHGLPAAAIRAVADDLKNNRGRSIVLAGDGQPPLAHALAHAMNQALENVGSGRPVQYTEPVEFRPASAAPDTLASLRSLLDDMSSNSGQLDILLIVGGNPAYNAPADLDFRGKLLDVRFRVHLSEYRNETSDLCHWHIPQAHYLESWSDVRAYDGTISIIQPLIAPLYAGRTAQELLDVLTPEPHGSAYDIVRAYWGGVFAESQRGTNVLAHLRPQRTSSLVPPGFDAWWRQALHAGVIASTGAPVLQSPQLAANWAQGGAAPAEGEGLEIVFRPDPTVFDGRFANNGWLQELPKPITKLTWDNAALISPATAVAQGLAAEGHPEQANGKVVTLRLGDRQIDAWVLVQPGQADNSITVHLGHGRTRAGNVGNDVGFNAYVLRTSSGMWARQGLALHSTGQRHVLALTQLHYSMEGRDLVRAGTFAHPPHIAEEDKPDHVFPTLYANDHLPPQTDKQWGMGIDLTACTGCSACVIACQSENNIPVVGKAQVIAERAMHWLRVDTYYHGPAERPAMYHQPRPCMHCEHAPCELVCPVEATQHSADGLNDMVYNRCVGTRYCSNNCPYKVRRFNFLQYADIHTIPLRLMYNPEVTVRSRGVMEKCTYCVQRIRRGEVAAAREDRQLGDGEIMTACQAACPTGAIIFGDLNRNSRVKQMRRHDLTYGLLNELNTRPRTSYLASLKNPNEQVPGAGGSGNE